MSAAVKTDLDLQAIRMMIHEKWRTGIDIINSLTTVPGEGRSEFTIACAEILDPQTLLNLAVDFGVQHLCHTGNMYFEADLNTSALMIHQPCDFVNDPVNGILNPTKDLKKQQQIQGLDWSFSKASDKEHVLSELEQYLGSVSKSATLLTEVRLIADELFTNAVYNAPFVNIKTGANQEKDRRDQTVQMTDGKMGSLFVANDSERIVIGCKDLYGALNVRSLIRRIRTCLTDGLGQSMNMEGKGGAGIGSYMVFDSSSSYYAGVVSGESTIVCCALPIKMSGKKRSQVPKNLSYFHIGGEK